MVILFTALVASAGFLVWAWQKHQASAPSSPVAATPPPVPAAAKANALAHRYSFSESGGTTVADSVGGPAWKGTLPNGGTFSGGQLTLSSNTQQYVQLPPGLIDPKTMTAVTIEAWATFGTNLPWPSWFFGFGTYTNTDGGNYLLCSPGGKRVAICGIYPGWQKGAEQQASSSGVEWSGQTLHITCVVNPPSGYVALYLNGTLAGMNNAETYPLSSVLDYYSYINRSLYSKDPYVNLTINEFRVYNRALTPEEIAATEKLGPDRVIDDLR